MVVGIKHLFLCLILFTLHFLERDFNITIIHYVGLKFASRKILDFEQGNPWYNMTEDLLWLWDPVISFFRLVDVVTMMKEIGWRRSHELLRSPLWSGPSQTCRAPMIYHKCSGNTRMVRHTSDNPRRSLLTSLWSTRGTESSRISFL